MRKIFSAVAIIMAAAFILAPAAGAGTAQDDDCNLYVTPVVSTAGSVTQGASLTVSGSGFVAGATVTISINGTAVGTTTADASGSFSTSVTVPASTPVGSATVVASSDSCNHTASTTTEVLSAGGTTSTNVAGTSTNVAGTSTAKPTAAVASTSSTLPRTGSNSGALVALAVGLTGLGAVALLAARRRSSDIT